MQSTNTIVKYVPKNQNRRTNRLKKYDYSQQGAYFLTICTYNRKCLFGKIINDVMILNQFGIIAQREWIKSSQIRAEIELDECIIMPNHLHGIVLIQNRDSQAEHTRHDQGEQRLAPTGLKQKSIGSLIAGFKSAVTKQINAIRKMPGEPVWQRNYYDHIIRNETSFEKIREYVVHNPQTWEEDKLFSL